jgi:bifunctional non-homologous end joining protein LigD
MMRVVIGGWTERALIVGQYGQDAKLHWVGNVRNPKNMDSLRPTLRRLARDTSPFAETVLTSEPAHWVEPKLAGEVENGVFTGPLEQYRNKRQFERTPEPSGQELDTGQHRFVVQEHHATALHYDFRLEIGGVLKSWSVPKGPSLDPTVKRLAVQVEDHPVDYLTFTGEIPHGNYGAGQVFQWDMGTFEPLDDDPLRAWQNGAIKFRLNGKRLKGEWRLVEMKSRRSGNKPLWLLFKVKDPYAIAAEASARPRVRRIKTPKSDEAIPLSEFLKLENPEGDQAVDVSGTTVNLTSLERVYWPREKYTKFDLLCYYARVWPRIEPFLRDRPAILQRYPRGVEAPKFIQHHLETVPIDYAVYTDLASLLYLVNLGTIEHHPWHSRVTTLDRPDWLAIDLDPGQAPWENVLDVARILRDILAERKLIGFPKTSGSKGIHIYLPLKTEFDYETVSETARDLAQETARRCPDKATIERTIALRTPEQVYVDWMQNARGKTMAAPYGARARPGATVSMPLTWDELPAAKISDFTIRNAMERPEAWKDFFDKRQTI